MLSTSITHVSLLRPSDEVFLCIHVDRHTFFKEMIYHIFFPLSVPLMMWLDGGWYALVNRGFCSTSRPRLAISQAALAGACKCVPFCCSFVLYRRLADHWAAVSCMLLFSCSLFCCCFFNLSPMCPILISNIHQEPTCSLYIQWSELVLHGKGTSWSRLFVRRCAGWHSLGYSQCGTNFKPILLSIFIRLSVYCIRREFVIWKLFLWNITGDRWWQVVATKYAFASKVFMKEMRMVSVDPSVQFYQTVCLTFASSYCHFFRAHQDKCNSTLVSFITRWSSCLHTNWCHISITTKMLTLDWKLQPEEAGRFIWQRMRSC